MAACHYLQAAGAHTSQAGACTPSCVMVNWSHHTQSTQQRQDHKQLEPSLALALLKDLLRQVIRMLYRPLQLYGSFLAWHRKPTSCCWMLCGKKWQIF